MDEQPLKSIKGRKQSVGTSLTHKKINDRRASGHPQTTKVSSELRGPLGNAIEYEMNMIKHNLLHGYDS
jgi:hypothetical protein